MRFILLFCNILMTFVITSGLILNEQNDENNLGEALFLTKYIEDGDIETAQKLALVEHPEMPIESYAGYLTVNKEFNSNMYFWFFPAKEDRHNAPVILWLQGGPGSPSVIFTITGSGPYNINAGKLTPNEYSWQTNYNVLYIDNPVGTGYSFTLSEDGFSNNATHYGQNLLVALQQLFLLFPKLQKNDFYAYGISYGGKYAPAIGYAIHQDNKRETVDPQKPKINLKGIIVESGLTDTIHQINFADYLYQMGLIDSNGRKIFKDEQDRIVEYIKSSDLESAFYHYDHLLAGIFVSHGTIYSNLTGLENYLHIVNEDYNSDISIGEFITKPITRRAIHVGNNQFGNMTKVFEHLKSDFVDSVADWVAELLSHYRILFYYGQFDVICGYPMAEEYLQNLKFSSAEEYKTAERHIWRVDNKVAGYAKQAGNLTEVLIRNAGHVTQIDQPKWTLDLLSRFIQHKSFE